MSQNQLVPVDKGMSTGLSMVRSALDIAQDVGRAENAVLYSVIGIGIGATLGTIAVLWGGMAL